jgi:hypothetical protein
MTPAHFLTALFWAGLLGLTAGQLWRYIARNRTRIMEALRGR